MSLPSVILKQDPSSDPGRVESRAITMAGMLADVPIKIVGLNALAEHAEALRANALPVGSVEFVREAMRVAGAPEPENMSYPAALRGHLHRVVARCSADEIRDRCFVKPVRTKLFTGFVFTPGQDRIDYEEHDREQLDVFVGLPSTELVWTSEAVVFVAEWRAYVIDGVVSGVGRYDPDGLDDVEEPAMGWLQDAATAVFNAGEVASFAIDVGRLADGRLALVEVNDAWALGLYDRALEPKDYLRMLWSRWLQITAGVGPKVVL